MQRLSRPMKHSLNWGRGSVTMKLKFNQRLSLLTLFGKIGISHQWSDWKNQWLQDWSFCLCSVFHLYWYSFVHSTQWGHLWLIQRLTAPISRACKRIKNYSSQQSLNGHRTRPLKKKDNKYRTQETFSASATGWQVKAPQQTRSTVNRICLSVRITVQHFTKF